MATKKTPKAKTPKAPRVAWTRLADWFRADVRHAAECIKSGTIQAAQHAPGTPEYMAYRVMYHAAVLAETGTVEPIVTRDSVGDVSVDLSDADGIAYLSDTFARVVACYMAKKRSFPAIAGMPGVK